MKNKVIVVTGGAGFIGSALIRHIVKDTNHSVINVDKLTYAGNLETLSSVKESSRYRFECVDICNQVEMKRIFDTYQPDIVMNLAAESHVDRSIDEPGEFIHTNIVGTYILLAQALAYYSELEGDKRRNFRFHHVSTDEVYGDLPHPEEIQSQTEDVSHLLFTEKTPYSPSSPYSASKAASDHLVRAWYRTYGLPILITNCSNNYGSYQFPEKLIPLVILNALEGKMLPIYGKGNQIRDWLYVDDHVRALMIVATRGKVGDTYNIGGHNEKQNIEIVKTICLVLDELVPITKNLSLQNSGLTIQHYDELITYVKDRPGHDMRYAIDASKIQNELGWTPQETFETGIRKTIEWYLNNQVWCQHVQDGSYQRERLGGLI